MTHENETYEAVVHDIHTLCKQHNVVLRDVLGGHMYAHLSADVSYVDESTPAERLVIFQYIRDAVLWFIHLRDEEG
jgi:hypothetical protein